MTRDEHKAIITEMMGCSTPEKQARVSELLTQLSDDYEKTLTESETLTATNKTLTDNNEKLRQVNADLFLKVGTPRQETENKDKPKEDKPKESELTFDGLFNEKGELK